MRPMTQSDLRRYFLALCVSAWMGWPSSAVGQESPTPPFPVNVQNVLSSAAPALPWAEPMVSRVELRLAIEDFAKAIEKGEKTEANSINRAASYMEPKQIENVIADYFDPQVGSEISSGKSSLETPS
ncbi:MAG: hypothetical protein ACK5YR_25215 [Pirellula sp.]